jgi:hypothetical protein
MSQIVIVIRVRLSVVVARVATPTATATPTPTTSSAVATATVAPSATTIAPSTTTIAPSATTIVSTAVVRRRGSRRRGCRSGVVALVHVVIVVHVIHVVLQATHQASAATFLTTPPSKVDPNEIHVRIAGAAPNGGVCALRGQEEVPREQQPPLRQRCEKQELILRRLALHLPLEAETCDEKMMN